VVFWVVKPYSDMVGYQCFRGLCYFHFQGELLSYPSTTWCHNPEDNDMNLCHENLKSSINLSVLKILKSLAVCDH